MNIYKGKYNQLGYGCKGQRGYGLGHLFKGNYNQSGYGVGGLFKRFINWMKPIVSRSLPIVKEGFKSIGKDLVKSASNIAIDAIDGNNRLKEEIDQSVPIIKEKLKNIGKDIVLNNLGESSFKENKLENMKGSGYKRIRKLENKKKKNHYKKRALDIFDKF